MIHVLAQTEHLEVSNYNKKKELIAKVPMGNIMPTDSMLS